MQKYGAGMYTKTNMLQKIKRCRLKKCMDQIGKERFHVYERKL